MLRGAAIVFVIFGLFMTLAGCGKKSEVKNPRRRTTPPPPAGQVTAKEKEFNGEWITKCIPTDATNTRFFVDYYWFENGGILEQQMWFTDEHCSSDKMDDYREYYGTFKVVGDSTVVQGARNVDIVWDRDVNPKTYTIFKLDGHLFHEGRNASTTVSDRPKELADRPYHAYIP